MSAEGASSGNGAKALEVSGFFAGHGRYDVVRDIALHVEAGEAVALLGPNGAGKTTFLLALMGLLKHRRGSVRIGGVDVSGAKAHRIARGHAGLVPQGRRLFTEQTVEDNLVLGAYRLRREPDRVGELLESVYALFPVLRGYRSRGASELSGGEQQMVAIGRTLMSDPDLLLLDEPSEGLAPIAIDGVAEALAELRRRGRSLLLVEQRIDLASRVCDRVYVLSGGEIVLEESVSAMEGEQHAMVSAYLG
jgi:branched-chain amino acid transport system ATP-binding protein